MNKVQAWLTVFLMTAAVATFSCILGGGSNNGEILVTAPLQDLHFVPPSLSCKGIHDTLMEVNEIIHQCQQHFHVNRAESKGSIEHNLCIFVCK